MSEIIRKCDCDYSLCKTFDHKKQVHIGKQCFHPNNFHHNVGIKFVKNGKITKDVDFSRRYLNWGV